MNKIHSSLFISFAVLAFHSAFGQTTFNSGVVAQKDDATSAPWQLLLSGVSDGSIQIIAGVNTSSTPWGSLQAYKQGSGPLPLVLQNVGGNVGIGISSPQYKLDVAGQVTSHAGRDAIVATASDSGWVGLYLQNDYCGAYNRVATDSAGGLTINHNGTDFFYIGRGGTTNAWFAGNVGIGVAPGDIKLDLYGSGGWQSSGGIRLRGNNPGIQMGDLASGATWVIANGVNAVNDGYLALGYNVISGHHSIVVSSSNNVGIGTTNPTYPLTVNGAIRAKEVIVDTGWSDYVFDEHYKLAPLSEVESHIKAEKHLPGIPSAQEVAAQGISVGEMQAKLLAKIEELTLHQIEQEKKLSAQSAQLSAQSTQLAAQSARIERLEAENASLK